MKGSGSVCVKGVGSMYKGGGRVYEGMRECVCEGRRECVCV